MPPPPFGLLGCVQALGVRPGPPLRPFHGLASPYSSGQAHTSGHAACPSRPLTSAPSSGRGWRPPRPNAASLPSCGVRVRKSVPRRPTPRTPYRMHPRGWRSCKSVRCRRWQYRWDFRPCGWVKGHRPCTTRVEPLAPRKVRAHPLATHPRASVRAHRFGRERCTTDRSEPLSRGASTTRHPCQIPLGPHVGRRVSELPGDDQGARSRPRKGPRTPPNPNQPLAEPLTPPPPPAPRTHRG